MRTIPQYEVWRHYKVIFTGTFRQCQTFLIQADSENRNEYEPCNRAMSRGYGPNYYNSLRGACCMTEFASIKRIA